MAYIIKSSFNGRLGHGLRYVEYIIVEAIIVVLSWKLLSCIIPENMTHFSINHSVKSDLITTGILYPYTVVFNTINFFVIEYCINVFNTEYKKNYVKYYFKYHDGLFKRFKFLLRKTMPLILIKIQKNITWIAAYVLMLEAVFNYNNGEIGSTLMKYAGPDVYFKYFSHIILFMMIVNLVFDAVRSRLEAAGKPVSDSNDRAEKAKFRGTVPKTEVSERPQAACPENILIHACLAAIIFFLFIFCQFQYPFAAYYNFDENTLKTLDDFINVKTNNVPESVVFSDPDYDIHKNRSLCQIGKGNLYTRYNVMIFNVKYNNKSMKIIPYFYKGRPQTIYSQNNSLSNLRQNMIIENIGYRSITVPSFLDYKIYLGANLDQGQGLNGNKPVFLLLPFFLLYFLILFFVVFSITFLVYRKALLNSFNQREGGFLKFGGHAGKILVEYLSAITIVGTILIINRFINHYLNITWQEKPLYLNLIVFVILQIIIVIMFSDNYTMTFNKTIRKFVDSDEYNYYKLIGMNNNYIIDIYNKKYGNFMLHNQTFQNLFFVIAVNFFIVYLFTVIQDFEDYIGIKYTLGFENVFTRLVCERKTDIAASEYIIPLLAYCVFVALAYIISRYFIKRNCYGKI
jgi:hypothetical protein